MAIKKAPYKITGMQKDSSESAFQSEFAWEVYNMRLTPNDGNTMFSLSNERGNRKVFIQWEGDFPEYEQFGNHLAGKVIGKAVVSHNLVLFTHCNEDPEEDLHSVKDRIYKLWFVEDVLHGEIIARGDFNFDLQHPIETTVSYESETIQKVYWVDGKNPTRMINIANHEDSNVKLDFLPEFAGNASISVTKQYDGTGMFNSGLIQYVATYYKKFGQETNIIGMSDLYAISPSDRGGRADETCTCSFKISVSNIDTTYDCIRIYSITRSSESTTPQVRIVSDIDISSGSGYCVDNGTNQEVIDPTQLLYVGGSEFIASTIEQKDGTLFLGDLKLGDDIDFTTIRNLVKKATVEFVEKNIYFSYDGLSYVPGMSKGSRQVRSFKSRETYRVGCQFMSRRGQWTQAFHIKDVFNDFSCSSSAFSATVPRLKVTLPAALVSELKAKGFVKARIVYGKMLGSDRTVLAQGIVCPTVFNYAQMAHVDSNEQTLAASWFMRDNGPINNKNVQPSAFSKDSEIEGYKGFGTNSGYLDTYVVKSNSSESSPSITVQFSHAVNGQNRSVLIIIPGQTQSYYKYDYTITPSSNNNVLNLSDYYKFFEYMKSIKDSGTGLPLFKVGNANIPNTLTSELSYDNCKQILGPAVDYTTTPISKTLEYNAEIETSEKAKFGSNFFYNTRIVTFHTPDIDLMRDRIDNNTVKFRVVGSVQITNTARKVDIEATDIAGALSSGASMSSTTPNGNSYPMWQDGKWIKDSFSSSSSYGKWYPMGQSLYMIYPWQSSGSLNGHPTDVAENIQNTSSLLVTKKMSTYRFGGTYSTSLGTGRSVTPKVFDSDHIEYKKVGGYRYLGNYDHIVVPGYSYPKISFPSNADAAELDTLILKVPATTYNKETDLGTNKPIRIKYKSTPHAVMDLGSPISFPSNAVLIGELYVDSDDTSFMGSVQSTRWIPATESFILDDSSTVLECNDGDTFFQRWDCLKTYPFTEKDENSVIDITSVMIESHRNLDGRCDTLRGTADYLYARPQNFNLFNNAYSNENDFFQYTALDSKYDLSSFRNQITWSKTKQNTDITDAWTNMTLASVLDLDGDKGRVTGLRRWANSLLCFQESGISEILFNQPSAFMSKEGLPIEIANSGKVNGKNYISSVIGCQNKWSLCYGKNGLYFMDDSSKSIYRFSGQLQNLSDKLGMSSWCKENISNIFNEWNPDDFSDFTVQHDQLTDDVYFINKDVCLAFNEKFERFTSFYKYEKVPFMINMDDRCLAVGTDSSLDETSKFFDLDCLWEQHSGEYNRFFNETDQFYVTLLANPDMYLDKVFNNVEFRSDTWNRNGELLNKTFDTIHAWNEYQDGTTKLFYAHGIPTSLKRKFRIWRAQIPRDTKLRRDRMRNTWLYLKLAMENPGTDRTVLHDMMIDYFV